MDATLNILPKETARRVAEIGQADILVGIPSYRNEATIAHVVRMAGEGLHRHFPGLRGVIMNSDGGSPDRTREVAAKTPVPPSVEKVVTVYQGISGKGSAFRAIFAAAVALGVRAVVVVDSDLRSITPDWIRLLASPALEGQYDYITPYYTRHKYDGTITNNLVYPLTRMLYGVDVRQPIGGDFGFSGELARTFLDLADWESDIARYGIDIWMTTTAINESGRVCQVRLGAKVHDTKDPAEALGPMFMQVVGTLFGLMRTYEARWKQVQAVRTTPILGEEVHAEPLPVPVTIPAMVAKLHAGAEEHWPLWQQVLAPGTQSRLEAILALPEDRYQFPAADWARMVLDFAVAFNWSGLPREAIVQAMTPLYYGRTAGLALESAEMTSEEFEVQIIGNLARSFEEARPYLLARWDEAKEATAGTAE